MVEVRYRGSFGDNLFQYCFGRLLAERWGYELNALPLPWFPATAERVAGRRYLSPFLSWSGMAAEERQLGMLLRAREMAEPARGRLVLYGWFHRWEYYREHEAKIRRWLAVDNHGTPADDGDLVVCLRTQRPESWNEPGIHPGRAPSWAMAIPSADSIERLVKRVPHQRLVLLADVPHSRAVAALQHLNPLVMQADSIASWNWLRTCRRMIVNVCHPSDWWAAWLSDAAEIYAVDPWPANRKSHCAGPYGCGWLRGRPLARPNLRVNEPRWIYDW